MSWGVIYLRCCVSDSDCIVELCVFAVFRILVCCVKFENVLANKWTSAYEYTEVIGLVTHSVPLLYIS